MSAYDLYTRLAFAAEGGPDDDRPCPTCNESLEWVVCQVCDGDGVFGHDCGEDNCPCLEPEDNVACYQCGGDGGWWICPNSHCSETVVTGTPDLVLAGHVETEQ